MNEQTIFTAAMERPPEQRPAYLDEVCGTDEKLRQRVDHLLHLHDEAGSFLEPPAIESSPTVDQPITEKPGTRIGPYKLLQEIGEGGMGAVYMAEQSEPVKRRVALKIIKPGMDTRQVVARFEAERQALAMMDHLNIAKVLDAGSTESGRPYFVMELVKGLSLTKYCDDKHLTPKERLELFIPVCHAVQHAHQKGILHRDLKPSNVLVALYDGLPVPKVIDFGVAKATSQKLTERTMFTQYGQIVGTLEYMAPEQAKLNQLDIDTRSDGNALAYGTNDLNQIVGAVNVGGVWLAAFWSDKHAMPVVLDVPAGDVDRAAFDINNDGIVVGSYYPGSNTSEQIAVAWRVVVGVGVQVDGPVFLPPIPGDANTFARRVNEVFGGVAQAAGHSCPDPATVGIDSSEAVLWSLTLNPDGTLADPAAPQGLGKLGLYATPYSESNGLNDLGDVVGHSDGMPFIAPAGGSAQPLPLPDSKFISGASGFAWHINNSGDVVGELTISESHGNFHEYFGARAYLWKEGEVIDLETQVDLGDWGALYRAAQINDAGIIAGEGFYGTQRSAFLLIPN